MRVEYEISVVSIQNLFLQCDETCGQSKQRYASVRHFYSTESRFGNNFINSNVLHKVEMNLAFLIGCVYYQI